MGVIKLTFYSGKLWHSDKLFPEICHECDNIANKVYQYCEGCVIEHNKSVLDWLSTAYEVVNQEVIPGVDVMVNSVIIILATADGNDVEPMNDGDQITLPEGYGIEDFEQFKKITIPEKPDNSLNPAAPMIDILNHAMKVSDQISKVVEPSESQEETQAPIGDFILAQYDIAPMHTLAGAYYHYADVCTLLNRLKEKLTRK